MSAGAPFGKYELLALLSVGGMAEVHLAFITGPGGFRKLVVVKRILPDLRDEPQFAEMFDIEARITSAFSHSNIAQVFEFGEIDSRLYLAMEFIHGIDLVKAIRRSDQRGIKVPQGLALRVVHDLCLALHYAHTFTDASGAPRPVVHRDVTPRNVMLSHSGTLKIIDFGIAKVAGVVSSTAVGSVKGSLGYMAPEQMVGEPVDGRADLFSAGVILHEFLTGKRLFSSVDAAQAMRQTVFEPVKSPSEISADVSELLSAVTMKALERDPTVRFSTGREMAHALAEVAQGTMFDEFAVGAWVREQFPEQLDRTKRMLESLSNREHGEVKALATRLAGDVEPLPLGEEGPEGQLSTKTIDVTQGSTVLVVDDSALGRRLVSLRLEAEGFRVVTCNSAEEALELLAEMRPDLVISDVRMGGLNGFEFCAQVRQREELQLLPVVFLSASCSAEERARGMAVGGDDFIRKPFEPADLVTRVRAHLRRVAVLRSPARRQIPI
ncbi:MAG: serine/threonine protein kinase [Myxococcaceae bacterium]|nr:serine/threonine protein kinase [Myxococcaceae bacterium]